MTQVNNQSRWRIFTIVLSAVIIVICGWFICRHLMNDRCMPATTNFSVTANTGTDKQILMIDGTQIWVRNHSRISYLSTFAAERTVTLAGEAYFDIANSAQAPFRIIAGRLAIEADLAELQVTTDNDAQETKVIVNAGTAKVSVNDGAVHNLTQGEQLTLRENMNSVSVENLPLGRLNEWRSEKLNFRLMTLAEIFDSLSGLYNIPFEFDRSQMGGDRYSLKLNGSEDLSEVLAIVSRVSGQINYTVDPGVKVRIFSNR